MKFTCFIALTLLIGFISQHSTNGLPIDDVTTQQSCLKGFALVDGECQRISSSSHKSDLESNSSEPRKVNFSDDVTTEESRRLGKSSACPEGKIRSKNGLCEDIEFKDLLATTVESKKVEETPAEHEKLSFDQPRKPVEHDVEPLTHTSEPFEHEHELADHTSEPVDHTNAPVEHEHESSARNGEKSDNIDVPKGCPPGTKADEQGACQDEIEHTSTTLTTNLKTRLPKDGSCPLGMELFKEKCVYVKSKQPLENTIVRDSTNLEENKMDQNDRESKLVPLLKGGLCPQGTEYYSNGLCRVRTGASSTNVLSKTDICKVNEIFVDGKCKRKESELRKTTTPVPETKPSNEDEVKPVERE